MNLRTVSFAGHAPAGASPPGAPALSRLDEDVMKSSGEGRSGWQNGSSGARVEHRSAPELHKASPPLGSIAHRLPQLLHSCLRSLLPKNCSTTVPMGPMMMVSLISPDRRADAALGTPRCEPAMFTYACTCRSTQSFPPPPPPSLSGAATHAKK
jgi:hypothetical protein